MDIQFIYCHFIISERGPHYHNSRFAAHQNPGRGVYPVYPVKRPITKSDGKAATRTTK
jgi:hypothetical protein